MLLICLMYSLDVGGPPANIGYFLVISSVFIGCAIYRDNPSSVKRGRFEIYRELSEESKTMDDLVEASSRRLQIHDYTDANKIIKSSISAMLDEGLLAIEGGKIKLAEQDVALDS